jgi:toxin ParE1/3/4
VRLSPRFLAEMKHQIAWIAAHDIRAAVAAEMRVRVALRRLGRFPELGRVGRVADTRELSVPRTRFVIAYRLRDGVVEAAALLHSAQQWPGSF